MVKRVKGKPTPKKMETQRPKYEGLEKNPSGKKTEFKKPDTTIQKITTGPKKYSATWPDGQKVDVEIPEGIKENPGSLQLGKSGVDVEYTFECGGQHSKGEALARKLKGAIVTKGEDNFVLTYNQAAKLKKDMATLDKSAFAGLPEINFFFKE